MIVVATPCLCGHSPQDHWSDPVGETGLMDLTTKKAGIVAACCHASCGCIRLRFAEEPVSQSTHEYYRDFYQSIKEAI